MLAFISHCMALTRPRLCSLVMATVLVGCFMAPGKIEYQAVLLPLLLIWSCVASGTILNCYMERHSDKLMERTKTRPLPTKKIKPIVALALGLSLGLSSLLGLYFFVNPLTSLLAATAIFIYLALYTPLKFKTPFAVWIGAVSGAIPPLMGLSSITGSLHLHAYLLFLMIFFWQIPHFLAISIFRKEDYKKASIMVYPNTIGLSQTRLLILISSTILLVISTLPFFLKTASFDFFIFSTAVNLILIGVIVSGLFIGENVLSQMKWAKKVFLTSLVHQPLLLSIFIFL